MGEIRKKLDAFINHPISGEKREKYLKRRERQEKALNAKRTLPGHERRKRELEGEVAQALADVEKHTKELERLMEAGKGKSPTMQRLLASQAKAAKDNASRAQGRAGKKQKELDAIEAQIRDCNTLIQAAELPLPEEMAEQNEELAINAAMAREDLDTTMDASVSLSDLDPVPPETDPETDDILAEMQKPAAEPPKKEAVKPGTEKPAAQEAPAPAAEPPKAEKPDDLVITFGEEEPQKEPQAES